MGRPDVAATATGCKRSTVKVAGSETLCASGIRVALDRSARLLHELLEAPL